MITPYVIIQKKRDGETLPGNVIETFIKGYVAGSIPDYQMAAFLMAVYFQGMDAVETATLTKVMMDSGDKIDPEELGHPTVDKHSTGGVGDKISIILAPLAAAAGCRVPMMSGRGLGHTGGTLDKLESIPGFNTNLEKDEFIRLVDTAGLGMIGQTARMVPADKQMYALRDVTATIDCIPLIAASIMSKKVAAGPQNLVLDVKVGRGAFMKDIDNARKLARAMVDIGTAHNRNVEAILTDMNTQPLGCAVGNSLEIIESAEVLQGRGPDDIRELTLVLTASMLVMAGIAPDTHAARKQLETLLDNGKAYEKFLEMVRVQDGDPETVKPPYALPLSKKTLDITADTAGYISGIDPMSIGLTSVQIGAGRIRQEDDVDPGVGFVLKKRTGDAVKPGDVLAIAYIRDDLTAGQIQTVKSDFEFSPQPVKIPPLILDRVSPR